MAKLESVLRMILKTMDKRLLRTIVVLTFITVISAVAWANQDMAKARINTALRYITMGWIAEAIDHASQAVKADPLDPEAHMLLALLQHVGERHEAALWEYDLAIRLQPDLTMLSVLMGDIHLSAGRLADAEAQYKRAIESDSSLGLAYYGLGRVLELQGDKKAIDVYIDGTQHAPDLFDLRFRLGKLLRRDGRYEEALDHLLYASLLDGNMADVRYELGLTYEALQRLSAAEHEYRTVLRLQPDHGLARQRLAELSSL